MIPRQRSNRNFGFDNRNRKFKDNCMTKLGGDKTIIPLSYVRLTISSILFYLLKVQKHNF